MKTRCWVASCITGILYIVQLHNSLSQLWVEKKDNIGIGLWVMDFMLQAQYECCLSLCEDYFWWLRIQSIHRRAVEPLSGSGWRQLLMNSVEFGPSTSVYFMQLHQSIKHNIIQISHNDKKFYWPNWRRTIHIIDGLQMTFDGPDYCKK